MKQHLEEDEELRRYLLGELTLEERVPVEARLFLDEEYSSQLKAVEDELVDDYASEELTADDRERFKFHLLSEPGRRDDIRLARALKRYLSREDDLVTPPVSPAVSSKPASDANAASDTDAPPSPPGKGPISFLSSLFARRPVAGVAFAAAALLILSAVIWLSLQSLRRQGRSPEMQAQEPTPQQTKPAEGGQPGGELQANQHPAERGGDVARREGQTRNEAARGEKEGHAGRRDGRPQEVPPPTRQKPTQVARFVVFPGGVVRGPGTSEKVIVSPDVGVVVLRLPLVAAGDYHNYRATLLDGNRVIYSRPNLTPEVDAELGQVVAVDIPANLLRPQRYKIKLDGVTAAGQTRDLHSYTFQVERQ